MVAVGVRIPAADCASSSWSSGAIEPLSPPQLQTLATPKLLVNASINLIYAQYSLSDPYTNQLGYMTWNYCS